MQACDEKILNLYDKSIVELKSVKKANEGIMERVYIIA